MSNVKWIKIITDIFDDEKILLIESLPENDSIIVIWFKLLCFAGKQNNNGVFMMNNRIAYTDEMLATIFRRPLNTVRLALGTFEKYGMIEIVNNSITIPNWGKHQNLDRIEKNNEYHKEYMREYRKKQRQIAYEQNDDYEVNVIDENCKVNSEVNVNLTLTPQNKKENKNKKENIYSSAKAEQYSIIISYLNEKAGTNYKSNTKSTQRYINARISEGYTIDDFKTVIDIKCAEWLNDKKMKQYLRPETLFGTKFESYLNQNLKKRKESKPNILDELF